MSYITLTAIKEGKKRKYTVNVNSLLHFTSILDQYERFINIRLQKGYIVLFDRYVYSIIARGRIRGLDCNLESIFLKSLPIPDICFYLDIYPYIAYERLNGSVDYWESGMDIFKYERKEIAFYKFQSLVREELIKLIHHAKKTVCRFVNDELHIE